MQFAELSTFWPRLWTLRWCSSYPDPPSPGRERAGNKYLCSDLPAHQHPEWLGIFSGSTASDRADRYAKTLPVLLAAENNPPPRVALRMHDAVSLDAAERLL